MAAAIAGGVNVHANPPPATCDDTAHCHPTGGPCTQAGLILCPHSSSPGHPELAPDSYSGKSHLDAVYVCAVCLPHGRGFMQTYLNTLAGPRLPTPMPPGQGRPFVGCRTKLCKQCVRDEMELYWDRISNAVMPPPGAAARIASWPTTIGGFPSVQDMCDCHALSVAPVMNTDCHACRDDYFLVRTGHRFDTHEEFLRERKQNVINGDVQCTLNGGDTEHKIPAHDQAARAANGDVRACPCGNKPMRLRPGQQEFISVCLTCMGVRIDPAHIPAAFQRARITVPGDPNWRLTRHRAALPAGYERTKGPMATPRDPRFRVNIELGFLTHLEPFFQDYFINGIS